MKIAPSKKVVITGGAGFIGSHIADACIQRGWKVTVIDNLSTGRIENIRHLIRKPTNETPPPQNENQTVDAFTLIQESITNLPRLQDIFKGVDYVFHQAAIPSVPRSVDNPLASHEANVNGTLNVLIAARDNQVKKVIYASSSSVYGETPTLPKQEDMIPNPQSPYAVNKIAGEYYCRVFNKVYGLPTACLRYFNVYGPRQRPDSQYAAVIPKFIRTILDGRVPVIYGDGDQSRDFTFVRDVVSANIMAAESQASGVYNIGRGERITLNQLIFLILDLLKRNDLQPVYQPERAGDIKHSLADITRARGFGYCPQYNIRQGLQETIRSFSGDNQSN